MSALPITSDTVNSIFGDGFHTENPNNGNLSSDYEIVVNWFAQQIDPERTQIDKLPIEVSKMLDDMGICDNMLFQKFRGMVRLKLNMIGMSVNTGVGGLSSQTVDFQNLLDLIINLIDILQQCYNIINLSRPQIQLMKRLGNSIFQSWIENPSIWGSIRQYYEQNIFSKDKTQTLEKISSLLAIIDLCDELTLLLLDTARNQITKLVMEYCSHKWDVSRLNDLLSSIKCDMYPIMSILVPDHGFSIDCLISMAKIQLVKLRTEEFFDIVVDYPDSKYALQEFRECLTTSKQRSNLVDAYILQSKSRLLHAGADTVDIIMCYISTVRSFLIVDHRGVLLDRASRPIRRYLKGRNDTIPTIVNAFLDTTSNNRLIELAIELRNTNKKPKMKGESARDLNWVPDPVDALPDFRKAVVEDIVESLISIFDSKNLFIDEFVKVFSKRLLSITDYDVRGVYSDLHLLKARFGSHEFGSLDVMLKDMLLSKKIDRALKTVVPQNVHASIISHLYWPDLPSSKFKMPKQIEEPLSKYKLAYEEHKKGRNVVLCPSLSLITLSVEVAGKTHQFKVTADKAAVLYFFHDQPQGKEVKIAMICMKLQMPLLLVRESLQFWAKGGVLKAVDPNTYKVNE